MPHLEEDRWKRRDEEREVFNTERKKARAAWSRRGMDVMNVWEMDTRTRITMCDAFKIKNKMVKGRLVWMTFFFSPPPASGVNCLSLRRPLSPAEGLCVLGDGLQGLFWKTDVFINEPSEAALLSLSTPPLLRGHRKQLVCLKSQLSITHVDVHSTEGESLVSSTDNSMIIVSR